MTFHIEKPFQKLLCTLHKRVSHMKPASFLIPAHHHLPPPPVKVKDFDLDYKAKDLFRSSLCSVWLTQKVTDNSKTKRIYIGRQAKAGDLKSEMCQEHSPAWGDF